MSHLVRAIFRLQAPERASKTRLHVFGPPDHRVGFVAPYASGVACGSLPTLVTERSAGANHKICPNLDCLHLAAIYITSRERVVDNFFDAGGIIARSLRVEVIAVEEAALVTTTRCAACVLGGRTDTINGPLREYDKGHRDMQ